MSDNLPDSGSRTSFATGAVRDASEGKGHPSSIPPAAIRRMAKRFEDGARKYDNHNWAQGMPFSRTADSAIRHLLAWLEGDKSEDHLGAVMWNTAILCQFEDWMREGFLDPSLDDRLYAKPDPVDWARRQCSKRKDKQMGNAYEKQFWVTSQCKIEEQKKQFIDIRKTSLAEAWEDFCAATNPSPKERRARKVGLANWIRCYLKKGVEPPWAEQIDLLTINNTKKGRET